ncbi:MAG: GDSL-type esterase/lipase family protein [Alistipes sp.]
MMRHIFLTLFLLCSATIVCAQGHFEQDIEAFRQADAHQGVTTGGILFVGSSTFTMWKDVRTCLPDYPITNRGFGGSSMRDVLYYFESIVTPHKPTQIIVYEGDNDLCNRFTSVTDFMDNVRCFVRLAQIRFPEVDICIVSIKPSPARKGYYTNYMEANRQLQQFCTTTRGVRFIDLWPLMVDAKGEVRDKDYFLSDSLHMTPKGYALWTQAIKPYLHK